MSLAENGAAVRATLPPFLEQTEKDDLYMTALAIEELNDRRAVGPLIRVLLEDANPHRRYWAARALGWISRRGRAAAMALGACVHDGAQPHTAREEAAESLTYVGIPETIVQMIAALRDPDMQLRLWAGAIGGTTASSERWNPFWMIGRLRRETGGRLAWKLWRCWQNRGRRRWIIAPG